MRRAASCNDSLVGGNGNDELHGDAAIHDFLRYQIKEHATGDPVTVQK